jgi:hypothetical protein
MHHALGSFSVDLGPNEIGEPNVRSGETWTRGSNVSKWPDRRRLATDSLRPLSDIDIAPKNTVSALEAGVGPQVTPFG